MKLLVIKNGVNPDILTEYGFKAKYDEDTGEISSYVKYFNDSVKKVQFDRFDVRNKRIRIFKRKSIERYIVADYIDYLDIYTLYDLIKADIVEKVEG